MLEDFLAMGALQVRYLPAELLREVNVVDTPGTNVILSRQQRLTEEYVPRADLVLFVLSADRPFTESEVNFLKYIRQGTGPF
jgi:predicted GTPase